MIAVISAKETVGLRPFLAELAAYHNSVSLYHKGQYPARDMEKVLQNLSQDCQSGQGAVAVAEKNGIWQGFVSVRIEKKEGSIGFLFVRQEARGKGLGQALMDWAMHWLGEAGCERISVKVVAGNPALHLYETYGFQVNAYILWKSFHKL